MITDEGYILPTIVALSSMKHNFTENDYRVFILSDNVTLENKELLKKIEGDHISISIIDVDSSQYSGLEKSYSKVSRSSLLKFSIPNLLPADVETALYIDGDVIVRKDLNDLFKVNIEGLYAAVIKDGPKKHIPGGEKHAFYGDPDYFNSGVMLLNIKKMREENTSEKLKNYRLTGYNYFMDQDAFNIVFGNSILHISPVYDFMVHLVTFNNEGFSLQQLKDFYGLHNYETIDDLFDDVKIIHYTFDKPWKYFDVPFSQEWMDYYKLSPLSPLKKLQRDSYLSVLYNSRAYTLGRNIIGVFRKNK